MTSLRLYFALLACVGLERLGELSLSNRNAKRAFARGGLEAGRRHFVVMALVHTLFLPACFLEAWLLQRPFPGPIGVAALLLSVLAMSLRWWAVRSLGDRWNVRIVYVPGDPPVVEGPYRFMRHPNYLAVVTELFCLPLVHGAWATAGVFTLLNAGLLWVRIRAEEKALGPLYSQTFSGVARFTPGVRR